MKNIKSLLIIAAILVSLIGTGVYSAFASAPSHASHSSVSRHTTPHYHCGVIGRQIGTGKPVGCVKPTTFAPVSWTSNDQHIVVPATWVLHYSCDGGPRFAYYVIDVTGKVTGQPDGLIEHNFGVCDNQWHSETYPMSVGTTIMIEVLRGGVAITISA